MQTELESLIGEERADKVRRKRTLAGLLPRAEPGMLGKLRMLILQAQKVLRQKGTTMLHTSPWSPPLMARRSWMASGGHTVTGGKY
jgi:hypothetical protein